MECDPLSVLSIYPKIFVRVFIVYHLLMGVLLFWFRCQYLPSDWLE